MLTPAHWIAPDGERLNVCTSHIAAVIADPGRFGVTQKWLRAVYAEHGEGDRFGCEGQAREVIIRHVVSEGWIRTRRYIRPSSYWSLTVAALDVKTQARVGAWVAAGLVEGWLKPATELRIYALLNGQLSTLEVADTASWPS